MSDENQIGIEDTLQDELVNDTVEVSNEDNLEEAAVPAEADGAKAAIDTKNAIDKSEFNTEIGESNDMSEFSIAISRSGLCWPIYSWQIDRKLKEKYPKIIQRVEAELKNSKESISDSKRKSNVPQIIDEQTSFESNEAESM